MQLGHASAWHASRFQIAMARFSVVGIWLGKLRNFFVQVTVVHSLDHLVIQNVFELLKVDHEPGRMINLALNRDFQRVVMAMTIEVGALAKDALVLFRSECLDCGSNAKPKIRICELDRPCW